MFFDRLIAHLQKSKQPQTHCNWFFIYYIWQIKKGLDLGPNFRNHANYNGAHDYIC